MTSPLRSLRQRHAAVGKVRWIGLRSERRAAVQSVPSAGILEDGLVGDHAKPGPRALTVIQAEHLPVIAALTGLAEVQPEDLRRNIVIEGINLVALRHDRLRLGSAVIQLTKPCSPCSRMEKALGTGGYNAMRGHGGYYAEVLEPGCVSVGDELEPIFD
ncbi:MOSC domain-containing protein [Roseovarius sp. 2305UL8-3]|uniref:MOSC domain-containing protein n=1 Tax=Roseovarius conchicola TaxID=3121636 RepID=UPI003526C417